ncbi:MAG TPA: arginine decarboxylase, pyruvoyl-dependent [Methanocorpusculum sp.]|nr:arginine decarboxylase, pyruvoyl-dependent [Methanocorpusculum sp.]
MVVPSKLFFTKGVGVHEEQLVSFEMALRDAHVAPFNLVTVSSILPPDAAIISREEGLKYLHHGEVVFCVMARNATHTESEDVAASVGLATPMNMHHHGYLSEYHSRGESGKTAGTHAEKLAEIMLKTLMDKDTPMKTSHIAASARGTDGKWTTVVALAVFVP